jgi:hypothetical protein
VVAEDYGASVAYAMILASIAIALVLALPVVITDGVLGPSETAVGRDLASQAAIPPQYHGGQDAVSPQRSPVVSRWIDGPTGLATRAGREANSRLYRPVEPSVDRLTQIALAQYQSDPDEPKRRVMILVGLGLGAAYLVFVAAWIWATRLRSRPPRH